MPNIHASALIAKGAEIGEGCLIGPFAIIGAEVVLGAGTEVGPHAVVEGRTRIGKNNKIFQFASIGSIPQDLKYSGEKSELIIGNGNVFREYVTVNPGTAGGKMKTVIGDNNLFMMSSHVGHDGEVGSNNVFANSSALAGHVSVGDRVTVGGMVGIHQFVRVGDLAILGAGAMVAQDIPPYCMAHGDRATIVGLNRIGLKRAGLSSEEITALKIAFRGIYSGVGPFKERMAAAREGASGRSLAERFLAFVAADSHRGIAPVHGRRAEEQED